MLPLSPLTYVLPNKSPSALTLTPNLATRALSEALASVVYFANVPLTPHSDSITATSTAMAQRMALFVFIFSIENNLSYMNQHL
jgi:hypothetical protein